MFTKQADTDPAIKAEAMRQILTVLGIGTAAGASARGIMGLPGLFGSRVASKRVSSVPVPTPYPVYVDEKERKKALQKSAEGAEKVNELWWYYPGMAAAGLGGLVGGHKLMDWLVTSKRRRDFESELEEAKGKYRKALLGQYDPARVPVKTASNETSNTLGEKLDELVKAADGWWDKQLGRYLVLAGLLAGGTGLASYKYVKGRSDPEIMEEAMQRRERERAARRPPETFAVPVPVRVNRRGEVISNRSDMEFA